MKIALIIAVSLFGQSAAFAQSTPEKITIDTLGRLVVASRNCGDGTSITPMMVSAYITQFSDQEHISFDKAKYMAISKGDEELRRLILSDKKDEFCLKVME